MWTRAIVHATIIQRARPKTRRKKPSHGKSLLFNIEPALGSGESAAVHYAQMSLLSFGDGTKESDYDPAVVRTVETHSVAGSDAPEKRQEKEARSSGGIQSQ